MYASLILAISISSAAMAEPPSDKKIDATAEAISINGKTPVDLINLRPPFNKSKGVEHARLVYYNYISCGANNNETCDGHYTLNAPAGWQVCNSFYTEVDHRGPDAWFNRDPINFYPNDPERPARFRAVNVFIHAACSHHPFGGDSSYERVEQVGLDLIPASASDYDRYFEGCWMPPG